MQDNTHVVIMAGGVGSRLWPVSTPEHPKQFIDILGVGRTLIQLTVDRFLPVCSLEHFWVVTSERYVATVREQLPDIPDDHILAEPEPRNTAPCIAYACWKIAKRYPDANIVVTPSDALVLKTERFTDTISKALAFTANSDAIVTVGITPTRPDTGYGYILSNDTTASTVNKVAAFKEKPDLATAKSYLADGHYFWNAGIFVWNVHTITTQLRQHAPQIAGIMDNLAPSLYTPAEQETLRKLFPTCDKISIDYAVMEKSNDIHVIADDLGWSDLGTWGSIKAHTPSDNDNNATIGPDIRLVDCHDCIVHASSAKSVIVQGLSGYIVSESDGRILIFRLQDEQHIKDYTQKK